MLSVLLLIGSCALPACQSASSERGSASALIEPRWITLKEGTRYEFKEGVLPGDGQVFLSGYEFRRRHITGLTK